MIKDAKCELNYIYEGQGYCSVCLGMIGGGKKLFKEENAVDRWEIYQLWCDLIGKTYPFEWNEIKAVLAKNKKKCQTFKSDILAYCI